MSSKEVIEMLETQPDLILGAIEWRDIDGYEGYYQVGSDGGVKSLPRKRSSDGAPISEKILRPIPNRDGYHRISLCKDGVQTNYSIHRLVGDAFIPNLLDKPQINHIDGSKKNNNVSNLEWVTGSENMQHAYHSLGLQSPGKGITGKDHWGSIPVVQKTLGGSLVKQWDSAADASRGGFHSGHICHCCKGKRKSHKGFVWEYFYQNKQREDGEEK